MVYQLRMYVCTHASGYVCLGLVLGRLPQINLFGVRYICCVLRSCTFPLYNLRLTRI